ncbi:MAG TPA: ABC transporter permease [Nocardioidaceae bacterium]|jgi:spermidine/putrescine transport system permease protein|nr:ABC transporter permease [Nocardioidaceae bacterium]
MTAQTVAAPPAAGKQRRWNTAWLLLLPGGLWLAAFFVVPLFQLVATSLYDPAGSEELGYAMTWSWSNYTDAIEFYTGPLTRGFGYAAVATVLCLVIGYPLAYAIAFKAGRWKNLMLILVIAPFFTSFLVRTLAWKLILSDNGFIVGIFKTLGLVADDGRLLATGFAVVAGLTYNFLPFMVLPLYASLEKIDHRLIEAAGDLYASPVQGFRRVTLPLSMPGVIAGTLLTFIPSTGDFINAQLLGDTTTTMIGNVIQSRFEVGDYPAAAALSVTLMVLIVLMVSVYIRRAGTEELL